MFQLNRYKNQLELKVSELTEKIEAKDSKIQRFVSEIKNLRDCLLTSCNIRKNTNTFPNVDFNVSYVFY